MKTRASAEEADDLPSIERHLSIRRASHLAGIPGAVLLAEIERRGGTITRVCGRTLILEKDLRALLRAGQQLAPAAAKNRAELIAELAERQVFGERAAEMPTRVRRSARSPAGARP